MLFSFEQPFTVDHLRYQVNENISPSLAVALGRRFQLIRHAWGRPITVGFGLLGLQLLVALTHMQMLRTSPQNTNDTELTKPSTSADGTGAGE